MSEKKYELVTIFGGDGFVGTQLVQQLAKLNYRIRVAVRRPDLAGHVIPLGEVGQILPMQANIRDYDSVERAVNGADYVVNLVGIKSQSGKQTFQAVHVDGARNVAKAAQKAGVKRLVHMSALGADINSKSISARSKAQGEQEVLKAFPKAIIMRPSIIFGPDDDFFNMFGSIAALSPILPVICPKTLFQPIYVGDVAQAFCLAIKGEAREGKIYELGGSEIVSMYELMQEVAYQSGRNNYLLPIPTFLAKIKAFFLQLLPSPLVTIDQIVQLQNDNIVSEQAKKQRRDIKALGITPTTMQAILPTYMWRFRKHGEFERLEII